MANNLMYCEICKKKVKSFYHHLKSVHNITSEEYRELYIPKRFCDYCNSVITDKKSSAKFCSVKCRKEYYNIIHIENSRKDPSNKVECKICGFMCRSVLAHVRDHHKIPFSEYKKKYNLSTEDCFCKEYINYCSEKIKGETNPGYKHGGKFSPFSKKFVKYQDLDNKEIAIENVISKVKQTKKDNPQNQTNHIEHWLKLGYELEEAKLLLSDRQATFSKEKCILRYGEEEGLKIWQDRQDRWQETLNSKSEEERSEINRKKITKGYSISKKEKELFNILSKEFQLEQQLALFDRRCFLFDIADPSQKKIIEYNGDYWHANPDVYQKDFFNKKIKKTALEIWELDRIKHQVALDNGYQILIIWERDYKNNKERELNKCKEFLNEISKNY